MNDYYFSLSIYIIFRYLIADEFVFVLFVSVVSWIVMYLLKAARIPLL